MQNIIQTALNGYFFSEKLQELPSGSGSWFSRTEFSQSITFKIIIAEFLNKQYCKEMELFPQTLLEYNSLRFY